MTFPARSPSKLASCFVLTSMLLVAVGCTSPIAEQPIQVAEAPPSAPAAVAPLILANMSTTDTQLYTWGLQVAGPDGEPLLGKDEIPRNFTARIVQGFTKIEFFSNWSGGSTGVVLGYSIDDGPTTWFDPAQNDAPETLPIPSDAFEDPRGAMRWRFYWEPSTQLLPGTGGWFGPYTSNITVSALP